MKKKKKGKIIPFSKWNIEKLEAWIIGPLNMDIEYAERHLNILNRRKEVLSQAFDYLLKRKKKHVRSKR